MIEPVVVVGFVFSPVPTNLFKLHRVLFHHPHSLIFPLETLSFSVDRKELQHPRDLFTEA